MLVSVIVPTHNRCELLKQTVASVQSQDHGNWELLLVDDGSSDQTLAWAQSIQGQDSRFRLLERKQYRSDASGAQVCRNLGLQRAKGEGVLFLDSDDLLAPSCLSRRVEELEADTSLDCVVGQAGYFLDHPFDLGKERIWGVWKLGVDDLDLFLADSIPWQTSGPLWRHTALERIGPWDERLVHVGHDHEFHVRALCLGIRHKKLEGVDYFWRVPRSDSLSSHDSFKRRHRDGGMVKAYRAIINDVVGTGNLTPSRAEIMVREVIKLAIRCRNFGGSAELAEGGLIDARHHHLLGPWKTIACRLLLRCWWRMVGRLPAMGLLSRLEATSGAEQ